MLYIDLPLVQSKHTYFALSAFVNPFIHAVARTPDAIFLEYVKKYF